MIDRSPPVTLTLDCGLLPPPREDALPDFRNQRTFFLFPRLYRARERPNFEFVLEGHEGCSCRGKAHTEISDQRVGRRLRPLEGVWVNWAGGFDVLREGFHHILPAL